MSDMTIYIIMILSGVAVGIITTALVMSVKHSEYIYYGDEALVLAKKCLKAAKNADENTKAALELVDDLMNSNAELRMRLAIYEQEDE